MRLNILSVTRRRMAMRWLTGAAVTALLAVPTLRLRWRVSPYTAAEPVRTVVGTLPDGTDFKIRMPHEWNGTLALYSHGLVLPGDPNPVRDSFDEPTGKYLLDHGTALAGSAFGTGWAVEDALRDQRLTLDAVTAEFGKPKRVIAYGDSLGGMISTALVERFPGRFAGGLAMCGVQAGGVGAWNHFLDSAFVFKTLLGPKAPFTVTDIADPLANFGAAAEAFEAAGRTGTGRARLALTAAIAQVPGAIDPSGPVSAPTLKQRFAARMALASSAVPRAGLRRTRRDGGSCGRQPVVEHRRELREAPARERSARRRPQDVRRRRSRPRSRPGCACGRREDQGRPQGDRLSEAERDVHR